DPLTRIRGTRAVRERRCRTPSRSPIAGRRSRPIARRPGVVSSGKIPALWKAGRAGSWLRTFHMFGARRRVSKVRLVSGTTGRVSSLHEKRRRSWDRYRGRCGRPIRRGFRRFGSVGRDGSRMLISARPLQVLRLNLNSFQVTTDKPERQLLAKNNLDKKILILGWHRSDDSITLVIEIESQFRARA